MREARQLRRPYGIRKRELVGPSAGMKEGRVSLPFLARPSLIQFLICSNPPSCHGMTVTARSRLQSRNYGDRITVTVHSIDMARSLADDANSHPWKAKTPDCSGAFALEGRSPPERNVNICCRFSEQRCYRRRNRGCLDPM